MTIFDKGTAQTALKGINMADNKVAVITGGARGIGFAIAGALAAAGDDIAIIDMCDENAGALSCAELEKHGVKARFYRANVSDFNGVAQTVKAICDDFGTIDILVNNAGINRDKLCMQMSEEEFDAVINVNLKGVFNMIRHISRIMVKARRGRIINISSVSGMMGNPGQANYSAAKAGVIGLTKTTARELASRGITVNAIAPGFIETPMTKAMPQEALDAGVRAVPLGRIGKPEDIAACAAFLASDAASYITGEIIKVDGGMYI